MCGIIACVHKNVYTFLINGLKQLQNRGYDSAGIATIHEDGIHISKFASNNLTNALNKLEQKQNMHKNSNIGIGHTRWATHGSKTDTNSHPHTSSDDMITLVHNGIIENYSTLKKELKCKGYNFASQTDTEVIANLIAYNYSHDNNIELAIQKSIKKMEGTWGLVILCKDYPNTLYCIRHGSPLLISKYDDSVLVASEQSGFCGKVSNYFALQNHDLCVIVKENDNICLNTRFNYENKDCIMNDMSLTPEPYPHWTLKEIHEQVDSSFRAISYGGRLLENNKVNLGGLFQHKDKLLTMNHIVLLGCGTSYHAGMIGMKYFKSLCDFDTIQLFDGAEFSEYDIPKSGKTALIFLSQSGETKDLHRCIKIGKDNNLFMIGVVNVVDSMIAREVDCGCYLNAGREVAVASTKSFTSQVILLAMIAFWFAQEKGINENKLNYMIKDLRQLSLDIKNCLKETKKKIDDIVPLFENQNSCFLLGKHKGEAIAREGALKIKEISYVHAEGYSTSSLKHGPFALLQKGFPVILIAPNNKWENKNINAYEEIITRNAEVITITNANYDDRKHLINVPTNNTFQDLLCMIPLQILAYKLSLKRGLNPDMPRNLAKVVTVE
jgi:glutamine---fructose-6-phosphate transaminase (isomerizing)